MSLIEDDFDFLTSNKVWIATRSEERFSRNAETDLVCRLLLEKKKVYAHRYFELVDYYGYYFTYLHREAPAVRIAKAYAVGAGFNCHLQCFSSVIPVGLVPVT